MKSEAWRIVVAGVLLWFAWRGSEVEFPWPNVENPKEVQVVVPRPPTEILDLCGGVADKTKTMLPYDREYLSSFYIAMGVILQRDADRVDPVIKTTDQWVAFHAGSLQLAIDKKKVGKYEGLGEAVDLVFMEAIGADARKLSKTDLEKLSKVSAAISYVFKAGEDE